MTILDRLLQHDAWTTRELLKISASLSDAELDREFDIGHRSLRRTFSHIISNMEGWCDLMLAQPRRQTNQNSIAGLIDRLDIVAAELLALGRSVTEENREDDCFLDVLDNPPRYKTFGGGLVHVATHGMHHRAQCLYLLRQLGVKNLIEGDALDWEQRHGQVPDDSKPTP